MIPARQSTALHRIGPLCLVLLLAVGCTPTVRVATDEPIRIDMNINIQHDIRVRVERELDDFFSDSGVF